MKIKILTFGITKDIIGTNEYELELADGANSDDLKRTLIEQFPEMEKLKSLMIAVNNTYSHSAQVLNEHDEIALIPPVSGG